VGDEGFERSEALIDAGVDLLVIDTAHGHSQRVLDPSSASSAVQLGAHRRRQRGDRGGARR
jgi:hypothetical protein